MTKREKSISAKGMAEVRRVQRNSKALAASNADPSGATHAPGTTPVSVRMSDADVQAIAALAQQRKVPVSHLVREWILIGLEREPRGDLSDALEAFDRAYAVLQRAIQAG